MAKGKKGSWAKGKSPAQGSTKKKISRPVAGAKKFTSKVKKGIQQTAKKGRSPLDGRSKGKK